MIHESTLEIDSFHLHQCCNSSQRILQKKWIMDILHFMRIFWPLPPDQKMFTSDDTQDFKNKVKHEYMSGF